MRSTRSAMLPAGLLGTLLSFAFVPSGAPRAATAAKLLDVPIWYLEFHVTYKATHEGPFIDARGNFTTSISMERSFAASWPLDLRNQGPSPVLGATFLHAASDGAMPSIEEQMQSTQALLARMETAANWMSSGGALAVDLDATPEEAEVAAKAGMDAAMGPAKLAYSRVDVGKGLLNELGQAYDLTTTKSCAGEGLMLPGGGQGITFEIAADSNRYLLTIPCGFSGLTNPITVTETSRSSMPGETPIETNQTSQVGSYLLPQAVFDDPGQLLAGMALVRGEIDPAKDVISGEVTIPAHYPEMPQIVVKGTFTIRYTLSPRPPTKSTSGGK